MVRKRTTLLFYDGGDETMKSKRENRDFDSKELKFS
jgi:hypothetical protein